MTDTYPELPPIKKLTPEEVKAEAEALAKAVKAVQDDRRVRMATLSPLIEGLVELYGMFEWETQHKEHSFDDFMWWLRMNRQEGLSSKEENG